MRRKRLYYRPFLTPRVLSTGFPTFDQGHPNLAFRQSGTDARKGHILLGRNVLALHRIALWDGARVRCLVYFSGLSTH